MAPFFKTQPLAGFLCLGIASQRCDFPGWCDFRCDLHTTGGGVHDLPLNSGPSKFVLRTPVGLGRPIGRPGCDQSHHGSRSSSTYWEQLLWANPTQKKGELTSSPRRRRRPEILFNTLSGSTIGCWNGSSTIPPRPTISTASLMVNRCFAMLFGRLASLASDASLPKSIAKHRFTISDAVEMVGRGGIVDEPFQQPMVLPESVLNKISGRRRRLGELVSSPFFCVGFAHRSCSQ